MHHNLLTKINALDDVDTRPKVYRIFDELLGKEVQKQSFLRRSVNFIVLILITALLFSVPFVLIKAIIDLLSAVLLCIQDGNWSRLGEHPVAIVIVSILLGIAATRIQRKIR